VSFVAYIWFPVGSHFLQKSPFLGGDRVQLLVGCPQKRQAYKIARVIDTNPPQNPLTDSPRHGGKSIRSH